MGTGGRNKTNEQIYAVVESINFGFQAVDHEFSYGDNVPKIINNGGILELNLHGKTWIITISEKFK